jgi:hypothetical protein
MKKEIGYFPFICAILILFGAFLSGFVVGRHMEESRFDNRSCLPNPSTDLSLKNKIEFIEDLNSKLWKDTAICGQMARTLREKNTTLQKAIEAQMPKVIWNGNWDDLWKIQETQNTKTGP